MNLNSAEIGKEYLIIKVDTLDSELNSFLFSLGCYENQPITVVSRKQSNLTVAIKDGRYSIDSALAEVIIIKD